MNQEKLLRAAAFTPLSLEEPNAWVGHLPFASWLIKEIAPNVFVELGTHTGNSYFSFCQSVKENGLSTKCYAVDTWLGDEHAGRYGDEVFSRVNTHNQEHYAGFSRLLRMTFDDALHYFADGSIELLHIDGLHTYEAVKHDFETWLPKLAPGAIVIFHDTNVRERSFGVWQLWEELQIKCPNNIEFLHSHGLGVVQLNDATALKKIDWLSLSSNEKNVVRGYFAALGERQIARFELELHLKPLIADHNRRAVLLNQMVPDRDEQIAQLNQMVAARDEQIAQLNQMVAARDEQIAQLNQMVADRDGHINDFLNSRSWRLTNFLRRLRNYS